MTTKHPTPVPARRTHHRRVDGDGPGPPHPGGGPAARRAARARTSGRGRQSPAPPRPRRGQAAQRGRVPDPTRAIRSHLRPATRDLAKTRGWSTQVAEGTVFGQWQRWSGSRSPNTRRRRRCSDGVLTVTAESTAWATQLRMMQAQLLAKIAAAVGDGVVTSLRITGPVRAVVAQGPTHIAGRGPRDTYG